MRLSTKDHKEAAAQCQANANSAKGSRWLHRYNGHYWISKSPVDGGTQFKPELCIHCESFTLIKDRRGRCKVQQTFVHEAGRCDEFRRRTK